MLAELLKPDRAAVLDRWSQLILESYPPDSARFLRGEKDRFLNPVGYAISTDTAVILEELLGGMDQEALSRSLDSLVALRAIQELPPSQAVGFLFLLKKAIREGLGDRVQEGRVYQGLLDLEVRIDAAALTAFDLYVQRRERIFEIKANEAKRRSELLLERMNPCGAPLPGEGGFVRRERGHLARQAGGTPALPALDPPGTSEMGHPRHEPSGHARQW